MLLNRLVKRLNKDENDRINSTIITESIQFNMHDDSINPIPQEEVDMLKKALSSVELCDTDSPEANISKLRNAMMNPTDTIHESIISTSKQVNMTKEDYETILDMVKKYKASSDEDKKLYIKKFKNFVKKVSSELRKCNDDKPADAFIVALTNKLCSLFDVDVTEIDDVSAKYKLVAKLNGIAKKLSKI